MQFNLHRHSCIFRVTKCWDKAKASIPYVLHRDEETAALCRAPSELEAQTGFPGASVNVLRKASSPCVPSSHLLTTLMSNRNSQAPAHQVFLVLLALGPPLPHLLNGVLDSILKVSPTSAI